MKKASTASSLLKLQHLDLLKHVGGRSVFTRLRKKLKVFLNYFPPTDFCFIQEQTLTHIGQYKIYSKMRRTKRSMVNQNILQTLSNKYGLMLKYKINIKHMKSTIQILPNFGEICNIKVNSKDKLFLKLLEGKMQT